MKHTRPDITKIQKSASDPLWPHAYPSETIELCTYIQELERVVKNCHYQTGHWMTESREILSNIPKENSNEHPNGN
jgi:hypothetical protein